MPRFSCYRNEVLSWDQVDYNKDNIREQRRDLRDISTKNCNEIIYSFIHVQNNISLGWNFQMTPTYIFQAAVIWN